MITKAHLFAQGLDVVLCQLLALEQLLDPAVELGELRLLPRDAPAVAAGGGDGGGGG